MSEQIRNFSSKLRLGDSELLKNFLTMADEKVRLVKEGYKPATKENCTSPTSRPTSHPTAKDKGKRGIGSSLNSLLSKCGKANATQAISATPEDLYSSSVPKKITAKVRHLQNGGTGIQYCSRDLGVASSAAPRTDARRNENCEWLTKKVVTGWGNATDVAIRYGEIKTEALASGHATIQSFPTHSEGTGTTTGQSLDQGKSCVSEGMDDLKPSARVQMHDVPVRRHQGAHHVGRPSQPLISIGRGRHMTEPSWTTKGRENPTV